MRLAYALPHAGGHVLRGGEPSSILFRSFRSLLSTHSKAASLSVTWPTSHVALVDRAAVQPGEWVLVHAAAGGVGLIAVQIAKGEVLQCVDH